MLKSSGRLDGAACGWAPPTVDSAIETTRDARFLVWMLTLTLPNLMTCDRPNETLSLMAGMTVAATAA
jgi:hypothetical protein